MANRKAAAPTAQPTVPAVILCTRTIDAIDDIACHHLAFEAIEQMLMPQKAGSTEDLAHIDRASLGWLFTLLNVGMSEQIKRARAAAELAHSSTSV